MSPSSTRKTTPNHEICAVVFDLDNTLVDTLDAIVHAFNAVMIEVEGRELSPAEVVSHFGPTEENCIRAILGNANPDPMIERFRIQYRQHIQGLTLYPGLSGILEKIANAGKPLGLSTGKGRWTTEATLEALGLASLFRPILSGDDVHRNKPDPEPLFRVAETVGCEPAQLVMVGDSLADMKAAHHAGARGLFVRWGAPEMRPGHEDEARDLAAATLTTVEAFDTWLDHNGGYASTVR